MTSKFGTAHKQVTWSNFIVVCIFVFTSADDSAIQVEEHGPVLTLHLDRSHRAEPSPSGVGKDLAADVMMFSLKKCMSAKLTIMMQLSTSAQLVQCPRRNG